MNFINNNTATNFPIENGKIKICKYFNNVKLILNFKRWKNIEMEI